MSARYLAVIDAGTTMLKLALLSKAPQSDQQTLCASWVSPRLLFEDSVESLLNQAAQWVDQQDKGGPIDIAVVGHIPEVPQLKNAKWKVSHEDALKAVTQRLSSTSTVVTIDVGSQQTMAALGKYGRVSIESFEHGVGVEAWNIVRRPAGIDAVRAWVPLDIDDASIENYLANKSIFSEMMPSSNEELIIEQAVAKAILQGVATQLSFPWHEVDLLVVTGAVLTQAPIAAQTVSMVLDGLTPTGTIQLISDPKLVIMACGGAFEAWSKEDYRVGRAMLHQTLQPLGTIVGIDTPPNGGARLAKVTLDLGLDHDQILEVRRGDLVHLPLPSDDQGALKVVGAHSKEVKEAAEQQAIGGEAGLIIDGRGRPLTLPHNDGERRSLLLQWDRQLNAHRQYGTIGETG
jgi:hypothetical protein